MKLFLQKEINDVKLKSVKELHIFLDDEI